MIKLVNYAQFVLIVLSLNQGSLSAYKVPKAQIDAHYPKGFEVSIPDEEGVTLFAFHAKLNEEIDGLDAVTWASDIIKPKNGRWTFRDRVTKLKLNDTLYYRYNVIYKGSEYRKEDGIYVVENYVNLTPLLRTTNKHHTSSASLHQRSTVQCLKASTIVNGAPVRCSGQIIFEDNFNGTLLDSAKWSVERRIPQEPDYEFNMYLNDAKDVLRVHKSIVTIKPKDTKKHYHRELLKKTFSLGSTCTGKLATEECIFTPMPRHILPPLISAQFSTKEKFSFKYGRVEIKAKMPGSMWVYPQLWLEPTKLMYGEGQYRSGQIRIAQTIVNGNNVELTSGLILNSNEPWRSAKLCNQNAVQNLTNEFHIYQLTWAPKFIALSLDDQEYCRFKISGVPQAFQNLQLFDKFLPNRDLLKAGSIWAPFDQEFYLTVGYGIGGHNDFKDNIEWKESKPWLNSHPTANNKFWEKCSHNKDWLKNGDFKIDYIKVYSV